MRHGKRLVLFDIDGTLITTNGLARKHFANAINKVFNRPTNAHEHDFAGKLDTQIYREILEDAGIGSQNIWGMFDAFKREFYTRLAPELNSETVTALPGTEKLLEALLEDDDITLALLTGNLEQGARLKLDVVNFNRFFAFGAFGDDGHQREDLPVIAVERARSQVSLEFKGREVVIIGDTPNDIQCGKHLGVRSIAVATGKYDAESLSRHMPDYIFESLEDTHAVIEAIINE